MVISNQILLIANQGFCGALESRADGSGFNKRVCRIHRPPREVLSVSVLVSLRPRSKSFLACAQLPGDAVYRNRQRWAVGEHN